MTELSPGLLVRPTAASMAGVTGVLLDLFDTDNPAERAATVHWVGGATQFNVVAEWLEPVPDVPAKTDQELAQLRPHRCVACGSALERADRSGTCAAPDCVEDSQQGVRRFR